MAHPNSRILVVEDDAGVAALERLMLERQSHAVDIVSDVESALRHMKSGAYDAVVLDYSLPDGACWPVLDAAREAMPPVPVVVVTGMGDERVAGEAVRRGAADYLAKSGLFAAELPNSVARAMRIAALESGSALLAKVVESVDDAVLSATLDGLITSWNPTAVRLLGSPASHAVGRLFTEFLRFDDPDVTGRLRAAATGCANEKPCVTVCGQPELTCADKQLSPATGWCIGSDGLRRDLAITSSIVRDRFGVATNLAFIARDVTEQNRQSATVANQVAQLAAAKVALESELRRRRAAEDRFRALFDHATVAIWVIGEDGRIVEANRQAEHLLGCARDQIVDRNATDFRAPGTGPELDARIAALRAGAKLPPKVWPLVRGDGEVALAEVASTVIDVAGERLILSMAKDVTVQVAAEAALRQSEARFAALLNNVPDAVWRATLGGELLFISSAVERITGFSPSEFCSSDPKRQTRVHVEDLPAVVKGYAQLAEGRPYDVQYRTQHKDGRELWMHARGGRVQQPDGSYLVEGLLTDITKTKVLEAERLAAEVDLRASEARYVSLLAHIPDLIWRSEINGPTTFVSPAVERITGFSPDDVYAAGVAIWPGRAHDEDKPKLLSGLAALGHGQPLDCAVRFQHKDSHYIWLRCRAVRVERPDGSVVVEGIATDITQLRKMEEQFLQAQRLEAVGQLTAGIAHDFNNLLMAILAGGAFIAEDLPLEHPSRKDALEIVKAAESAARLTRQLLAFSRKQHMEPTLVDVNETLTSMARLLRRSIPEDIAIQTSYAEDLPLINVDVGQLEQVVLNLAVNARDAMPNGGVLAVATAAAGDAGVGALAALPLQPGSYVRISVTDNGHGMDAATMARIFEPFFTTKGVGKGTGLGLSTCFGIAHQSGGCIDVRSQVGQGSTFDLYLPCAPERTRTRSAVPETTAPPVIQGRRILVVEDSAEVLRAVSRTLSDNGHTVLTASCLAEAQLICRSEAGRLDLLISDTVMAGGAGPEVIDALRKIQPGLPAILMSGYTDHPALREGALPEGVQFLKKPFAPAVLCVRVSEVLRA